jgi:hypothetical protein
MKNTGLDVVLLPLGVLRDDLESIAPCQDICDDLASTVMKRSIYIEDCLGYQAQAVLASL